jgi:siroheme synthase
MVALADSGMQVVRLKSGDPLLFGRAGEEIESLRKAGIPCEIVPGVTSALGAAAAVQIPLTHRRLSSALVFLTAQQASESEAANWSKLVSSGSTLVIYMPGQDFRAISGKLTSAGLDADTPCALISQATTPRQRTVRTTIGALPVAPRLVAPTLLVVGEVVGLADSTNLEEFVFPTSDADLPFLLSQLTVSEEESLA